LPATTTLVSCGQVLSDQKVLIVHPETLSPCAVDEVGEIWVSGASIAQGYWQDPDATEQSFYATLPMSQTDSFLRTGDLGLLHDGELYITGRLKDLIIIRGYNHYPQDLELTVQKSHPALELAPGAAVAIPINGIEQLAIAQEIDRTALRQLNVHEVIDAMREAIADQHDLQAGAIALLKPGSLPKTTSGKVQRYICRNQFLDGTLEAIEIWYNSAQALNLSSLPAELETSATLELLPTQPTPRTEEAIQTWLIQNLAQYLKVDPDTIDITLPFAYYGLDSSVAVSLTGELAEWMGLTELEPILFWEHPSIEALAQHLGTKE
jgi:acyl carrier protein